MNGESFFGKEVFVEGVIGGGAVNVGAVVIDNYVSGLLGLSGGGKLAMNTVLKVLEGYGAAVAEQKTMNRDLKAIMHGAKYIIPGMIVQDVVDYAAPIYLGQQGAANWAWAQGAKSKTWIMTRVKPTG